MARPATDDAPPTGLPGEWQPTGPSATPATAAAKRKLLPPNPRNQHENREQHRLHQDSEVDTDHFPTRKGVHNGVHPASWCAPNGPKYPTRVPAQARQPTGPKNVQAPNTCVRWNVLGRYHRRMRTHWIAARQTLEERYNKPRTGLGHRIQNHGQFNDRSSHF